MTQWVLKGLITGTKTTRYPASPENALGTSPGRPKARELTREQAQELEAVCPTDAIIPVDKGASVDYRRCVQCFRCTRGVAVPAAWDRGFEWAAESGDSHPSPHSAEASIGAEFSRVFGRSLSVLVVDAGDCGSCLSEIRQLSSPYYNFHRLGIFITPTPRQADVLVVVGPVTDHMLTPLRIAYEAMPSPKRVMAVGVCAISGGIFGPSFAAGSGVAAEIPVDVVVPGCPPPPLAILHGLLVLVRKRPPASLVSTFTVGV
jgi:Ni,Fe-hydrogenase III small subunit